MIVLLCQALGRSIIKAYFNGIDIKGRWMEAVLSFKIGALKASWLQPPTVLGLR